jgi:hypothetical protein
VAKEQQKEPGDPCNMIMHAEAIAFDFAALQEEYHAFSHPT